MKKSSIFFRLMTNCVSSNIYFLKLSFLESPLDRKKSRDLKEENVEFGIELLNKTEQSTKSICFEALNMHDRKLWILKLKDAIGKYQEKSDQEKAKKYSGIKFTSKISI